MASSLPSNVHISTHPCLLAKLSQLRSSSTTPKETKALVHEISLLLASEALARVLTVETTDVIDLTPLDVAYNVQVTTPKSLALVPVLRSGLGMLEGTPPSLLSGRLDTNLHQRSKPSSLFRCLSTTSASSARRRLSSQ